MTRSGLQVVFTAPGAVTVRSAEVGEPEPGTLLVETRCTLISSGTELSSLSGRSTSIRRGQAKYPLHPGYSNAGVVAAVGEGVTGWREGDALVSETSHAAYVRARAGAATTVPIPPGLSFERAAFTTLGAVALYGTRRAHIELGESVVVLGLGVVGQLAAQFARLNGAWPLIAADKVESRRATALECGADLVLDATDELPAEVRARTGGDSADVVLDCTGRAGTVKLASQCLRIGGRLVIVGSPHEEVTVEDLYEWVADREITVLGVHQPKNPDEPNRFYRFSKGRDRRMLLQWLQAGKLQVDPLISHRLPVTQAAEAYALLRDRPEEARSVILTW
jgi:2-desacetyl-2-hydroxyethyl bacteriochlorophyllide A dehydrogenase